MPVLREAMKSRLIQMEEALFIASGQRFEAESEAAAEAAYLSNQGGHLLWHPYLPHTMCFTSSRLTTVSTLLPETLHRMQTLHAVAAVSVVH